MPLISAVDLEAAIAALGGVDVSIGSPGQVASLIPRGSGRSFANDLSNQSLVFPIAVGTAGNHLFASVVVGLTDPRIGSQISINWGGTPLQRVSRTYKYPGDAGAHLPSTLETWVLQAAPSGTHDLTVQIAPDGVGQYADAIVCCCDEAGRVNQSSSLNDFVAFASGAGSAAATPAFNNQPVAECLLYGAIAKREKVTRGVGAWSNGFGGSTRYGTDSGDEAYDYTLATGSKLIHTVGAVVPAAKTGFDTSSDWHAALAVVWAFAIPVKIKGLRRAPDLELFRADEVELVGRMVSVLVPAASFPSVVPGTPITIAGEPMIVYRAMAEGDGTALRILAKKA